MKKPRTVAAVRERAHALASGKDVLRPFACARRVVVVAILLVVEGLLALLAPGDGKNGEGMDEIAKQMCLEKHTFQKFMNDD